MFICSFIWQATYAPISTSPEHHMLLASIQPHCESGSLTKICATTCAGLPLTIELAGTESRTTEPALTMALCPMLTPDKILTPSSIKTLLAIIIGPLAIK